MNPLEKNVSAGITTVPNGERRMCGMGFSETCPASYAVGSPPSFAASACAASWHVSESRNATYQMAARDRVSGLRFHFTEETRDTVMAREIPRLLYESMLKPVLACPDCLRGLRPDGDTPALAERRARRAGGRRTPISRASRFTLPPPAKANGSGGRGVPRRRLRRSGDGSRGSADRRVAQRARRGGVRAEVPARPEVSPPGRDGRCAARPSHGARGSRRVPRQSGAHRRVGLFGGRPPGLHGGHALRCRRSRERPTRSTA